MLTPSSAQVFGQSLSEILNSKENVNWITINLKLKFKIPFL